MSELGQSHGGSPIPAGPPRNGPPPALPSHDRSSIYPEVIEHPNSAEAIGRILTALEADETTVGLPYLRSEDPTPFEARQLNQTFRHGGWQDRRRKVLAALQQSDASPGTIDRFCECGSRAWILRASDDSARCRLATNRCRSRWCVPCAVEQARLICSNIRDACQGKDLRFLTLTLRSTDQGLSEQLSRLRKSFRRLRQRAKFRGSFIGGVYFVEITRGSRGSAWHPHLHIHFEGRFIPHELLKSEWLEITGDSYIVHIERVGDSGRAAGYVSKYASKAIPASVINDPDALQEAMQALHGARTFHVFGSWEKLELSKPKSGGTVWVPLMPLAACIARARRGDEQARQVLSHLARSNTDGTLDALFDP